MSNKLSKEDTRSRITKAATKLFAENGYRQTTIAEIAKMVGLAMAAFMSTSAVKKIYF